MNLLKIFILTFSTKPNQNSCFVYPYLFSILPSHIIFFFVSNFLFIISFSFSSFLFSDDCFLTWCLYASSQQSGFSFIIQFKFISQHAIPMLIYYFHLYRISTLHYSNVIKMLILSMFFFSFYCFCFCCWISLLWSVGRMKE